MPKRWLESQDMSHLTPVNSVAGFSLLVTWVQRTALKTPATVPKSLPIKLAGRLKYLYGLVLLFKERKLP